MGWWTRLFGGGIKCARCGAKPDPSIYRPGVMIMGGDFGKCPKCGRVYCGNCKTIQWLDKSQTVWMAFCPRCEAKLKADIF